MNKEKVVFLDRDGTINVLGKGYITSPNQLELERGSDKAIRLLNDKGFKVFVVTNQSIIGRGIANHGDLHQIHTKLDELLEESGAQVDFYLYCPHKPRDNCSCRKPKIGMFQKAKSILNFDISECWMVGDDKKDIIAGKRVGLKTILVKTGNGIEHQKKCKPDHIAKNLFEAALFIGGYDDI